jgi:hypothetical protein
MVVRMMFVAAIIGATACRHPAPAPTVAPSVAEALDGPHTPPDAPPVDPLAGLDLSDPVDPVDAAEEPTRVTVDQTMCPAWLPDATTQGFTPEQTRTLATAIEDLLAENAAPVGIDYKRGIRFVQSDLGSPDDAPFDGAVNRAEASHVCASQALWLYEYVRSRFGKREVVCCGNVCGAPTDGFNAEYWVVFRPMPYESETGPTTGFAVDAWLEVDATGEHEKRDQARRRAAAAAMKRLARSRCPG